MPKVSIIMPVYNQEKIVAESIQSALDQNYKDKEIIVIDDESADDTYKICKRYPVTVYRNRYNRGLDGNLDECVKTAKGEYIIILCGDDVFTNKVVVSDMVKIFDENPRLGVIGRYYYQYLDGYKGAVMTIRGDILTSSCQPSGIGFRKSAIEGKFADKLFIEVPSMVKRIIDAGWACQMIKYDTIAARLHPEVGPAANAAANPEYYKTLRKQSPTLNWYGILGDPIGMYLGFIQIKNRAPQMLLSEIFITIKLRPSVLFNIGFWTCALTAVLVPGWILRPLANFYRHRITRHFCRIIGRTEWLYSIWDQART